MELRRNLHQTVCINLPQAWNREFDDLGTASEAYGQSYFANQVFTSPLLSTLSGFGLGFAAAAIGFFALKVLTETYYPRNEAGDTRMLTGRNVMILTLAALLSIKCSIGLSLIGAIALTKACETHYPSLKELLYTS